MDENGFIFTTDAILALVVVIVLSASLVTYITLPIYNGQDHQHLEALADSALNVMEQDGTLRLASIESSRGNTSGAQEILNAELNTLIPSNVAYNITVSTNTPVSASDNRGLIYATDTATKVRVLTGPQEGWMGRAWYKLDEVKFIDQQQNVTATVWNFHNWLSNFQPWGNNPPRTDLEDYPYWGSGNNPSNIIFSIPSDATLTSGMFLLGSNNHRIRQSPRNPSYSADVVINNIHHIVSNSSFTFLNIRPNSYETMYNYKGDLTAIDLKKDRNTFYVNFQDPGLDQYSDMPWFSILAKYTTLLKVPEGIITDIDNFTDAAGVAVPTPQNLDGVIGNEYGFSYNLNTGQRTFFNTPRSIEWTNFLKRENGFSDGVPFVLTKIPPGSLQNRESGCAVSQIVNVDIPTGTRIFDSYVVINSYGGVDNTLVEVWDGTEWKVAFNSFDVDGNDYSDVDDGYGNNPGIIYIKDYLKNGNNRVRVTIWDRAPGDDYDFVGLTNCYAVTTYSKLPIKWENFAFSSHQSSNNGLTQTKQFTIGAEAKEAFLFVGSSTTTRHIKVEYTNGHIIYDSDTVPFVLDMAALDATATGGRVITNSSGGLKPGTYNLKVTITGPSYNWESGDNNANAAIFSGTRVAVLYPKFLQNIWTSSYATTAVQAQYQARQDLIQMLTESGITPDPNYIKEEAMYTGDLPNAIPIRLDLWKQ